MNRHLEFEELAQRAVRLALAKGASGAEATILQGDEFQVTVRMGEVEILKDAGSRAIGLRVLYGLRSASAYTSDLSEAGLARMVESASELAKVSMEDPHGGLPDPGELGCLDGDLELYSPDVDAVVPARRIELSRLAEQAALQFDPRITNSEGSTYSSVTGWRVLANSDGFCHSYRTSSCSLSAQPVVQLDGRMERDYWHHSALRFDRLESPESIGRTAAERVVRRLGARKVQTQAVPVIFEPRVARSLLGHVFSSVAGEAVYHQASFLAGDLGKRVASPKLTVIDDATLPGRFGSSPSDDEGVRSRRTVVIGNGVLQSYLLNSYSARKLKLRTTANASRGLTGSPSTGAGNLYVEAGEASPRELISSIKGGLYVTELIGSGVNIVSGDYSRGAAGLWIEDGEPAFPVHEITVSGNLRRMLEQIEGVGNDLEFRGSIACPTLLLGELTVSGT